MKTKMILATVLLASLTVSPLLADEKICLSALEDQVAWNSDKPFDYSDEYIKNGTIILMPKIYELGDENKNYLKCYTSDRNKVNLSFSFMSEKDMNNYTIDYLAVYFSSNEPTDTNIAWLDENKVYTLKK